MRAAISTNFMAVGDPLNDEEIEIVREICGVTTLSEIANRAATLTADQNERTRGDIVQWEKFNNKFSELDGGGTIGLKKNPEKALLRICNRVRTRFGYSSVASLEDVAAAVGVYCSYTPEVSDCDC